MSLAPEILVAAASTISERLEVPRRKIAFERLRLDDVLDSLATLCVQRGKGEVYAVALQLHASSDANGLVTLFIAGNEDVPKPVQLHLYHIWSILSKIASQCTEFHKLQGQSFDSREPSTTALSQDRRAKEVELKNMIYAHCREKVASRIAKRLDEFVQFVEKLKTHYHQGPPITDDERLQAFTCLAKVSHYIRFIHSKLLEPKSLDITKFVRSMRFLDREVHVVLEAPKALFTEWSGYVGEGDPFPLEPFPLKRYLKKVVAIETHFYVLLGAVDSSRIRQHLNRKVDIVPVPGAASNATVPANVQQLIEETLRDDYEDVLADYRMLFRNLATSQENPFRARVHCECALIGYFRSLPPSQPPPLDYLGMSKLSCKACAIYMEACNTTRAGDHHANFYTRGTHQKWHYPWGFPASDDSVAETFRGLVEAEITKLLIQLHRFHGGSSSDEDDHSRGGYDDPEMENELLGMASEIW